jgi:hypothetical protein
MTSFLNTRTSSHFTKYPFQVTKCIFFLPAVHLNKKSHWQGDQRIKIALFQKVAQNVTISWGYFIFSSNDNEPPKVAKLVKICPFWSPWPLAKMK